MKKPLRACLLGAALALGMAIQTHALFVTEQAEQAAQQLYALGLFRGTGIQADGTPSFALEQSATRGEALTMLVRLLGAEQQANHAQYRSPFTDAGWASSIIGYAYQNGITSGISETRFGTQEPVSLSQFLTMVLRALGWQQVDWRNPYPVAQAVGLQYPNTTTCLRGDMAQICYSALFCEVRGTGALLYDVLATRGVLTQNAPQSALTTIPAQSSGAAVSAGDVVPTGSTLPAQTASSMEFRIENTADMLRKMYTAVQNRVSHVRITVPQGMAEEYMTILLSEESLDYFSDIQKLEGSYYINGYLLEVDITYNDAVAVMAYLEGKLTNPSEDVLALLDSAQHTHAMLVRPGMSDYDKVKAFHDYLVNFNTYQQTGPRSHSAVGALIDGAAVCEGYAEAFDLLCYLSDIPCLQITGTAYSSAQAGSGYHSWNKVQLGGAWYNIDVTWDDPTSSIPVLRYDYFLISDARLAQDHTWLDYDFWPAAPADYIY